MLFNIEVKDEAKQDIADAMSWYASKVENLDKKFRQSAVKRFPYVIVYEPEQKNVVIYSVFNTWQHPKKKLSRIK
jgi:hypothetical protein